MQQLVAELPGAAVAHAGRLGLALTPQLDQETWRHLVTHLARLTRTTTGARQTLTAWLGDALAYGENSYRGRIVTCAGEAGLEPGTLRNAKMVCARIPVSCRHDALSWTHHCEVGLAFANPNEIEWWLAHAEAEKLSTAALRKRIRAHLARQQRSTSVAGALRSVETFQLMRELRAACRVVVQHRNLCRSWSPGTASSALEEIQPLTEFVDAVRARALQPSVRPVDLTSN
ncbi:MAG: hypothetical protein JNG82_15240 [Opitutaceae bacterium]|nr:hypothetical protein [Opitutaceae bacterium]